MDIQFNIRKEFHFQWRNLDLEDIFSTEPIDRAFDLLTRSGEIEKKKPSDSPKSTQTYFGFGEQSTEKAQQFLELLIEQHQDTAGKITPFSSIHRKQLAILTRIYFALLHKPDQIAISQRRRNKPTKQKLEEIEHSPLVHIAVKAGLPLLFALIRRSWQRNDSQICEEVFLTANEILMTMPSLALFNQGENSLSRDSLDRVTQFLKASIVSTCSSADSEKQLASSILLQLTTQRGNLRNILDSVRFIFEKQIQLPISKDLAKQLFEWYCYNEKLESTDGEKSRFDSCVAQFQSDRECDIYVRNFVDKKINGDEKLQLLDVVLAILAFVDHLSSSYVPASVGKHIKISNEPTSVYMWGSDSSGQLCDTTGANYVSEPTFCNALSSRNPVQIELGSHCTVVLAEDGMVYACGKGEYGRLGIGSTDSKSSLAPLSVFREQFIQKVATSRNSYGHGLAIDKNNEIWSWGDGDYGKLGHGDTTQCNTPKKIEALSGRHIVDISCGYKHSACVTEEGEVYTWGLGDYGRLGHGNSDNSRFPKLVQFEESVCIRSVSCGISHTMALSQSGEIVWSWGDGDHGKLGHGDTNVARKPEIIATLKDLHITKIECGDEISMALTSVGKLYSWGRGEVNGHESSLGSVTTPKVLESLENWTIIDMCAGGHCIALASNGDVFTWGKGENGPLGHSNTSNVDTPTLVTYLQGRGIKQIAAGSQHSVAWTIPPLEYQSRSSICGVETVPFCIDLHADTFKNLREILEEYATDFSNCREPFSSLEEQQFLIVATLNILRTNLYHVTAVGADPKELGLSSSSEMLMFFRDQLLRLLNSCVAPRIQQAVQKTFEVGWGVLLPTSQERRIMLSSLLPQNEETRQEFSSSQYFLMDLLVNSLLDDNNLIDLPHQIPSSNLDIPISVTCSDEICLQLATTGSVSDSHDSKELKITLLDANKDTCLVLEVSDSGLISISKQIGSPFIDVQLTGSLLNIKLFVKENELSIRINEEHEDIVVPGGFTEVDSIHFAGSGEILSVSQVNTTLPPPPKHIDLLLTLLSCVEHQTNAKMSALLGGESVPESKLSGALMVYLRYLQKHLLRLFSSSDTKNMKVLVFQHSSRVLGSPQDVVSLALQYGTALIEHCTRITNTATKVATIKKTEQENLALAQILQDHSVIYSMLPQFFLSLQIAHNLHDKVSGSTGFMETFTALTSQLYELLDSIDALNHILPTEKAERDELSWNKQTEEVQEDSGNIGDNFVWIVNVERLLASLLGSWVFRCISGGAFTLSKQTTKILKNFYVPDTSSDSQDVQTITNIIQGKPDTLFTKLSESHAAGKTEELSRACFAFLLKFYQKIALVTSDTEELPSEVVRLWEYACFFTDQVVETAISGKEPKEDFLAAYLKRAIYIATNVEYYCVKESLEIPDITDKAISKKWRSDLDSSLHSGNLELAEACRLLFVTFTDEELATHFKTMENSVKSRLSCLSLLSGLISRTGLLRSVQLQILRNCFMPSNEYFSDLSRFMDEVPSFFRDSLQGEIEKMYFSLVRLMSTAIKEIGESKPPKTGEYLWVLLYILRILGTKYFTSSAISAGVLPVLYQLLTSSNEALKEIHSASINYLRILLASVVTKKEISLDICRPVFDLYRNLISDACNSYENISLSTLLGFLCTFSVTEKVQKSTSSPEWFDLWLTIIQSASLPDRLMTIRIIKETFLAQKRCSSVETAETIISRLFQTLSDSYSSDATIAMFSDEDSQQNMKTDGCSLNRKLLHKATIEGNDRTFRQSRAAEIHNTGYVVGTTGASSGIHRWTLQSHHDARSDETLCVGVAAMPIGNTNLENTGNMWLYRAYNGALYHSGKCGSLEPFTIGDTIDMEVDMSKRTLTYYKNGKCLGVAYSDLPEEVFPVILFYATSTRARASFIRYSYQRMLTSQYKKRIPYTTPEAAFRAEMGYLIRDLLLSPVWNPFVKNTLVSHISITDKDSQKSNEVISAMNIIGNNETEFYRIGSRVFHSNLGLGTVIDLYPSTIACITIYFDIGTIMVTPTSAVKLKTGTKFSLPHFLPCLSPVLSCLVQSLCGDTFDGNGSLVNGIQSSSSVVIAANRALRALLPSCEDFNILVPLIDQFLPIALDMSTLRHTYSSEQLEQLISYCNSIILSKSQTKQEEELSPKPEETIGETPIPVSTAQIDETVETTGESLPADKTTVETSESGESLPAETLSTGQNEAAVEIQNEEESQPTLATNGTEDEKEEENAGTMETIFAKFLCSEKKLSKKEKDIYDSMSLKSLKQRLKSTNTLDIAKNDFVKVLEVCDDSDVLRRLLDEHLLPLLHITLARELIVDLLLQWKPAKAATSATSSLPYLLLKYQEQLFVLLKLVAAGRVSGFSANVVSEIFDKFSTCSTISSENVFSFSQVETELEGLYAADYLVPLHYDVLVHTIPSSEYVLCVLKSLKNVPILFVVKLILCTDTKLPQLLKCALLHNASILLRTNTSPDLQQILQQHKNISELPQLVCSTFETLGGFSNKKNTFLCSPFLQTILSIMLLAPCEWNLSSGGAGDEDSQQKWKWYRDLEMAIQTARALKFRTEFPSAMVANCTIEILSSNQNFDDDDEEDLEMSWADNSYWTVEMDEELVSWTTEHPGDWSCPIDVYMTGCSQSGQLAEATAAYKNFPVTIESMALLQPKQVLCGSMCTIVLADDGSVHSCGKGEYGRLGTGSNENQYTLVQLPSIQNVVMKQIALSKGSYGHALAIDETGGIWSWGDGDYGKLGHGNTNPTNKPKLIESMRRNVSSISCGFKHSACVTTEGELYTWGMGDYGRLGHGESNDSHNAPKLVERFAGQIVIQVSCGSSHTLALTDDNTTWSWGDGDYGKLGHGDTTLKSVPTKIEMLSCNTVKKIDTGEEYSLCLTENGRVLTWGRFNSNVLGHGEDGHLHVPLIVNALEDIVIIDVSAGASHCIALSDDYNVYAWGNNEEGQLGLGHKDPVAVPQLVEFFCKRNIRQISAGSSHSSLWTTETNERKMVSMSLPSSIPLEYKSIQHISLQAITHRLSVLQYFSDLILANLQYINYDEMAAELGIDEISKFLLAKSKLNVFRKQLSKTTHFDGDTTIQLDGCIDDIFTATFLQLTTLDPKELRGSFRPYKIRYDSEIVEDYDGIQEECMDQLQMGAGGMLFPTSNGLLKKGLNQDVYMFSKTDIETKEAKFRFLGRLLGISIRTKLPLKLHLAFAAFKLLAGNSLDLNDLRGLDLDFVERMERVASDDEETWRKVSLNLTSFVPVITDDSVVIELSKETRKQYAEVALTQRMHSWDRQAFWVREGIKDIVPVPLLSVLTGRDLQGYISAPFSSTDSLIWDDLAKTCLVVGFPAPGSPDDDSTSDNPHVHPILQWFWAAVEKLTPHEKILFCQFVAGTTRPFWDQLTITFNPETTNTPIISSESCGIVMPNFETKHQLIEQLHRAIHNIDV